MVDDDDMFPPSTAADFGSLGGKKRAQNLSSEERREIAQRAAQARWKLPRTTHEGDLNIPGIVPLRVANLEDGRRVMISKAFLYALGRPWKGTYQRTERPNFIEAKNLDRFVSSELQSVLTPIEFLNKRGQIVGGYLADLLPLVCEVYLRAREAGELTKGQEPVADHAEIIVRGLAKAGIRHLVDDATGFARTAARDELQAILGAYISAELLPWTPRFPDVFYEQLHRVRGWPYRPGNHARNGYIGKLTTALIYDPLPKGVREELEKKNPYIPKIKGRKHRHHQLLTENIGHPHLEKQITAVTTILRISDNWDEFLKHFSKAFSQLKDYLASLRHQQMRETKRRRLRHNKHLSPLVGAVRRCQGTICSVSPWGSTPPASTPFIAESRSPLQAHAPASRALKVTAHVPLSSRSTKPIPRASRAA